MNLQHSRVALHEVLAGDYRIMRFESPDIARAVRPGQFVHIRIPRLEAAVLRRPFSVLDAEGDTFSMLYKEVGRGTAVLATVPTGTDVSVMGPLGNGFPQPAAAQVPVLVAGGYGVAPLHFLARRSAVKGIVCIGGRTARDILCADDFGRLGWQVHVATEDGSLGAKGLVTGVLATVLASDAFRARALPPEFFCCGPDGMLKAVGDMAMAGSAKAWLSLDKRMGCGVGACLACVQRIRRGSGTELVRVCKEGPVFESRDIVWEGANQGP